MENNHIKIGIYVTLLLQNLLLTSCMSLKIDQNPWEKLKMKQFCLPSTYALEITEEGCKPEKVTVNGCLGVCPSYVKITGQEPYLKSYCRCCSAVETKTVKFVLRDCAGGDRAVSVKSAVKCSCMNYTCD